MGITTRFVGPNDVDAIASKIDARTKAIYCESIGNPAGNVADLSAIADVAHAHGVPVIVDNTVPSPYLCRPFEHGCDIVVHSLTKYIGGHGTIIGGMIVDSGKFDWVANKERFRRLNEPDVSYHGVVYTETGQPPTSSAHASYHYATSARQSHQRTPSSPSKDWKPCRYAWNESAKTPSPSHNICKVTRT